VLTFRLDAPPDRPLRLLAVGAHADDIEIGAGGTILSLLEQHPAAQVRWVVLSARGPRAKEAKASAAAFLAAGAAGKGAVGKSAARGGARTPARARRGATHRIELRSFRDGFLPYDGAKVKAFFETLKPFEPDLVLTHLRTDLHQDHRVACELTWNTFRNHTILEYEVPKYDGDLGAPNVFVPLTEAQARRKLDLIERHFATQRGKHWFRRENFEALLRLRGMECRAPSGLAEAFQGRKVRLQGSPPEGPSRPSGR